MPDHTQRTFKAEKLGYKSTLIIKDLDCVDLIIKGGDVAFGETYINDMWEVDNLPNLLSFITQNSECLENFFHARKFKALMLYISSLFCKNSKKGSKKNTLHMMGKTTRRHNKTYKHNKTIRIK
jgi:cyclopropane-fatty-acyl-phospholipid synthase